MRVEIYWNLRKRCWSVRHRASRKVIGHRASLVLTDCAFHVSEPGRQRVLRERRKNVHAWVVGTLAEDISTASCWQQVAYNPYKQSLFTCGGTPITSAPLVKFNSDKTVWCRPPSEL